MPTCGIIVAQFDKEIIQSDLDQFIFCLSELKIGSDEFYNGRIIAPASDLYDIPPYGHSYELCPFWRCMVTYRRSDVIRWMQLISVLIHSLDPKRIYYGNDGNDHFTSLSTVIDNILA